MRRVAVLRVQPQVERKERETDALVLLRVPELVSPEHVGRLAREHHHMAEGDRGIATTREDEMRESTVAHVEEATIAEAWPCERKPAERVSDRIGVVRNEPARDASRRYRAPPAAPR
jgi:hypothetical protein